MLGALNTFSYSFSKKLSIAYVKLGLNIDLINGLLNNAQCMSIVVLELINKCCMKSFKIFQNPILSINHLIMYIFQERKIK